MVRGLPEVLPIRAGRLFPQVSGTAVTPGGGVVGSSVALRSMALRVAQARAHAGRGVRAGGSLWPVVHRSGADSSDCHPRTHRKCASGGSRAMPQLPQALGAEGVCAVSVHWPAFCMPHCCACILMVRTPGRMPGLAAARQQTILAGLRKGRPHPPGVIPLFRNIRLKKQEVENENDYRGHQAFQA